MNKFLKISIITILFVGMSSFGVHKFYMSIYQINYVPKKKMLQITSRIFIDDFNEVLEKKYHKKVYLGSEKETVDDESLMKKYLSEKMIFKVNGTMKPASYLSKEVEDNVLICYFRINEISKITKLEIENSALMELNSDQQNIIQANISGEKQSLLFTTENFKGLLK